MVESGDGFCGSCAQCEVESRITESPRGSGAPGPEGCGFGGGSGAREEKCEARRKAVRGERATKESWDEY